MEPRARVELATCRLRIGCSTTELPRPSLFTIAFAEKECQFATMLFGNPLITVRFRCREQPGKYLITFYSRIHLFRCPSNCQTQAKATRMERSMGKPTNQVAVVTGAS